jgi:dTDP-4-dehydrorhamnose 3,5-epimerase
MIEGIRVKDLMKNVDERGFFSELLRSDWTELLEGEELSQYNLAFSYPGIVRAWHRHLKGQNDYFICVEGTIEVCAYDDRAESSTFGEVDELILGRERLRLVKVPGILWHGYKVIGDKPAIVIYGVNRLYDYSSPDEERRPWNDEKIVPLKVNGVADDPRVSHSWDWDYTPNK